MILTDDNFATIVKAVELGHGLYDNLTKYIRFQMGVLFGLVFTFLGAAIGNVVGGLAFVPLQTLWLNFTTQVFQAIGLGYGEHAEGLMQRKPRDPEAPILPRNLLLWLAFIGLVMGATTIGVGCHPDWKPSRDGTTVAFEVDDIDATIAKLKERGVTFEMEKIETPVCWMAQFRDPDGNKLVVQKERHVARWVVAHVRRMAHSRL